MTQMNHFNVRKVFFFSDMFFISEIFQGGNSARIVNCVLALKSYSEWKQGGGNGLWKFGGNLKSATSGKYFVRKTSEPFMNSFTKTASMSEKTLDGLPSEPYSNGVLGVDLNEMVSMLCGFVFLFAS